MRPIGGASARSADSGDRRRLDASFVSLGRALRRHVGAPTFFLALHPLDWSDFYFGLASPPDRHKGEWLRQQIHELSKKIGGDDSRSLDRLAEELLNDIAGQAQQDVAAAAAYVLIREPVGMGSWPPDPEHEPAHRSNFVLAGSGEPTPGWFQDALDFGSVCDRTIELFFQLPSCFRDRSFCHFYGHFEEKARARILEVTGYVKRTSLMRGRLEVFVAEYLYFLAASGLLADPGNRPQPSDLDHFFLPLRGLMQWRASACWLQFKPMDRPPQMVEPSIEEVAALELALSNAILQSFTLRLRRALPQARAASPGQAWMFPPRPGSEYCQTMVATFAVLWWADEVLLEGEGWCHRALRDQAGALVTASIREPCRALAASRRLLSWQDSSEGLRVQLNLEALDGGSALAGYIGFSRVQYRLRLFSEYDRQDREPWDEIEGQLEGALREFIEDNWEIFGE